MLLGLVALGKRCRPSDRDGLVFEVHIPVDVEVDRFSSADAGQHHRHHTYPEVVFLIGAEDELLLPFFQAAMLAFSAFWRLGQIGRGPYDDTILYGGMEKAPDRRAELLDVALGHSFQGSVSPQKLCAK